jgi:hypothetical protein
MAIHGRAFALQNACSSGVKIRLGADIPVGTPLPKISPGPASHGRSFALQNACSSGVKIRLVTDIPVDTPLPKLSPGPAIHGRAFAGATHALRKPRLTHTSNARS